MGKNISFENKKKDLEFKDHFDVIFEENIAKSGVVARGSGWEINNDIRIEPLYLNLVSWRAGISLGLRTRESFYNFFIELFDDEFERFIGWRRPKDAKEMLELFETLLNKEAVKESHLYYVVLKSDEIIGIMYLYDLKLDHRKANLTVALKEEYRGKGIGEYIIKSVIDKFMNKGREKSFLIRLGIVIETTNKRSIALLENNMVNKGFEKEGLLRSYYGVGENCYLYSYII